MKLFIIYCLSTVLFFRCDVFRDDGETKTIETLERPEEKQNVQQKNQDNEKEKQQQEQEEGQKGEDKEPQEQTNKEENLYNLKPVMNRERLTNMHWITAEAKAGDKLLITLEGIEQIPWFAEEIYPFDDLYHDIIVNHCLPGGKCPGRLPYHSNCFVRYQEVHDGEQENIIFPDDVFSLGLKISMNGKIYPIGQIIEHKETEIIAEFIITEEMINRERAYTSAYFIKIPLEINEITTIVKGFIGFINPDDCPKGLPTEERSFYRYQESLTPKVEYFGSVTLQRKEGGRK